MRDWFSRKLLWLAWRIDREQRFVFQAGRFKFERNWQQPQHGEDQTIRAPNDRP